MMSAKIWVFWTPSNLVQGRDSRSGGENLKARRRRRLGRRRRRREPKFCIKSNFANTNFHAFRIIFTEAYLVNVEVSI